MARRLVVFALLLLPLSAASQRGGIIDLGAATDKQIAVIERMLFPHSDMDAKRQVVLLHWLIDLYDQRDDSVSVEKCYRRIFSYYPQDLATMNRYAEWLLDRGHNLERADSVLRRAESLGRWGDMRALDRGETLTILARVELAADSVDLAARHAAAALKFLDEDESSQALRALAEAQRRSGRLDEAARTYLDLIGIERGTNLEDINALQLFLGKTTRYNTGSAAGLIEDAIEAHEKRVRDRLRAEGAEVVELRSRDGTVLEGTLRKADGGGAVLFVPGLGGSRSAYAPYAQLLSLESVTTLSIDPRGHGASRSDSLPSFDEMPPRQVAAIAEDVIAGARYLQDEIGIAPRRIVIVTEGRASPIVEKALYQGRLEASVVYLSPSFDDSDLELANAVSFRRDLPLLFLYSKEDLVSLRSVDFFLSLKRLSGAHRSVFESAGYGVDMLRRSPEALEAFQTWVLHAVDSRP